MDIPIEKTCLDVVVNTSITNLKTDGFDVDLRTRFYSDPLDMRLGKRREFKELYSLRFDDSNNCIFNAVINGDKKSIKISIESHREAKDFVLYLAKQYADRHDLVFRDNTF